MTASTVRRLITPLQINIAQQQVNVAGSLTTENGHGAPGGPQST